MAKLTVERSVWIDAPRERVWQAVTDPEQITQWFLPPALGAHVKRDDSGKMFVSMGPMEVDLLMLEGIDPPRQATIRGLPDRLIAATYMLEEENGGTRVTVVMSGFESLPEDARQDRLDPSGAAWEKALENLKAYVKGTEMPYPQGLVASMFGYRRESIETFAVERSIWIAAPRERVWQAITDPKLIQQWFSPGTAWRLSALEVGGLLSVYDPETDTDMYGQTIEVVDPPYRLVTRSAPEAPESSLATTWTLTDENGGTRLTILHSGYELQAGDTRHDSMEQNAFGFGMMLDNTKAYLEGKSLPYPGGF